MRPPLCLSRKPPLGLGPAAASPLHETTAASTLRSRQGFLVATARIALHERTEQYTATCNFGAYLGAHGGPGAQPQLTSLGLFFARCRIVR
jgi:hypothetical protein